MKYTLLIKFFRKDIKVANEECIFPIGLLSALVLSDYYLKPLDDIVNKNISCKYYGRYVDDILIVTEYNLEQPINKSKIIQKLFIEKDILNKNNLCLKVSILPNLHIQKNKIIMFYFNYKRSKNLINIYNEIIKIRPSEENILPDFNTVDLTFDESAYFLSNIGVRIKT